MVYSTFSSFMTARSGVMVNQQALNITAQNMANVGVRGYTRQRLDMVSIGSYNGAQKIAIKGVSVAGGARATGVTQLRDSYLDARFRHEMAGLGELDTEYSILDQLQSFFEEWDKNGLTTMLNDLMNSIAEINLNGGDMDVLMRTQMELILSTLNSFGGQIDGLKEDVEKQLDEVYVKDVNDLLLQIAELNKTIRAAQANGASDLELQDARNLLLDELSTYMDIKVTYEAHPNNPNVQEMTLEMKDDTGTWHEILKNDEPGSLQYNSGSKDFTLLDNSGAAIGAFSGLFSTGALQGMVNMLTGRGEFDGSTVKGIPYYEEMMNMFASKFVDVINKTYDPSGTNLLIDEAVAGDGFVMGNLKIADGWRDGTYKVESGSELALKLTAVLKEDKHTFGYEYPAGTPHTFYTGTFFDFYNNFSTTLGSHVKSLETLAKNKDLSVTNIDNQRLAISAVSMDEETANMIMYQKAFNASARMMTTLDEALDTLINGTGIVGR